MNITQLQQFLKDNHKKYFIYDFDGTLADIQIDWTDWHEGTARIMEKYNPDFNWHGGKVFKQVNDYIKEYGQRIRDEFWQFHREYEQDYVTGYLPNTTLLEFLKSNPSQVNFLYTSNMRQTVMPMLKEMEIVDSFDHKVTRDDVMLVKPEMEGMEKIYVPGTDKKDYLMFGDSHADEGLAYNFGIDFWQVEMK